MHPIAQLTSRPLLVVEIVGNGCKATSGMATASTVLADEKLSSLAWYVDRFAIRANNVIAFSTRFRINHKILALEINHYVLLLYQRLKRRPKSTEIFKNLVLNPRLRPNPLIGEWVLDFAHFGHKIGEVYQGRRGITAGDDQMKHGRFVFA